MTVAQTIFDVSVVALGTENIAASGNGKIAKGVLAVVAEARSLDSDNLQRIMK